MVALGVESVKIDRPLTRPMILQGWAAALPSLFHAGPLTLGLGEATP